MKRVRQSKSRLKANIKTFPIRGKGDDAGRWFHCQYCGFVCDIERDKNSGGKAGIGHDYAYAVGEPSIDPLSSLATMETYHVSMENGMDGNPKTIEHTFIGDVSFGCPFCGTTDWKG